MNLPDDESFRASVKSPSTVLGISRTGGDFCVMALYKVCFMCTAATALLRLLSCGSHNCSAATASAAAALPRLPPAAFPSCIH